MRTAPLKYDLRSSLSRADMRLLAILKCFLGMPLLVSARSVSFAERNAYVRFYVIAPTHSQRVPTALPQEAYRRGGSFARTRSQPRSTVTMKQTPAGGPFFDRIGARLLGVVASVLLALSASAAGPTTLADQVEPCFS